MNIIIQDLLTSYTDEGDRQGPVIIMLHGWGATAQNFDSLATQLAPRFRIVRLDLPGFGRTQPPPEPWHIQDYAQFIQAFLDKLGIRQPHALIGHSFGGRIIIAGAGRGLLSSRRLVLMGSSGLKHSDTLRNQIFKLIAKAGKATTLLPGLSGLRTKLRRRLYRAAGSNDYLTSGQLRQTFLNTINEDLGADAAAVTVPALLIWGAADTDTPPADGRRLAHLIPHSSLHIIPGAGHYVHLDAPAEVLSYLNEFLA